MDNPLIPIDLIPKLAARAAELWLDGVGQNKVVETLKEEFSLPVTRGIVLSLHREEAFKEIIMKASEEGTHRLRARASMSDGIIISCLVDEIKSDGKDKVRAASILADILLNKNPAEDGQKQAQNITVILPGGDK